MSAARDSVQIHRAAGRFFPRIAAASAVPGVTREAASGYPAGSMLALRRDSDPFAPALFVHYEGTKAGPKPPIQPPRTGFPQLSISPAFRARAGAGLKLLNGREPRC